ncbi:MAG: PAS domain S-box protein [Actinomycetota bacterium]|nr:PAS domain S-box protein [Actinomycetota bacterium]
MNTNPTTIDPESPTGTITILLCDDAAEIRCLLSEAIADHADMTVVGEAATGRAAIELAAAVQPDVVILDLSMPEMDGFDALPHILAAAPAARVVAFSGRTAEEAEASALAAGACAYIPKGAVLSEIVGALRAAAGLFDEAREPGLTQEQERRLFSISLDLLCVADRDGYFRHLSPSWERTLGWTLEELKSRPFVEFVHPGDALATEAEMTRLVEGFDTVGFENRYASRTGGYRWLSWRATPSPDGLVYASARDVTEEKAAAAARDALATIVDCSFDAIVGVALDGSITSWNAAAESLYELPRGDALGRPVSILLVDADEARSVLARARAGEVSRYETRHRTSDGREVPVWVTVSPVRDAAGEVVGASHIVMDIADRKHAESEAQALRAELEDRVAQRTQELEAKTRELEESMAELDSFAYTVSHDLRAPLRALDGFSRILSEDLGGSLSHESAEHLSFIRANAQGMQKLVDGLLAFSRLGRRGLELVPVSPEMLARQALVDLGVAVRPGVTITVGDLPGCLADATLLKQVFANLVDNALKFTRGAEDPAIQVSSFRDGDEVVYFVRDNGVGFDPRYADKIFGVFQRLHRPEDYEGTGIGLANVQRIVEKHGGRIWCDGAPGSGAVFYFTIGADTA